MLNHSPFYNSNLKNVVAAFGTLFNDLQIVRDGTTLQTVNVPLTYASRDKAYIRRTQDNDLNFNMRMQFPRMAFQLVAMNYDSQRKINQFPVMSASTSAGRIFHPVPYNLEFELYIATANIEDGLQIIEQILPYFSPEYTVTMTMYPGINLLKDISIQLNSVTPQDNTPDSDFEDVRVLEWTLSFTAKAWVGGAADTSGKRINDIKIFTFDMDNITVNPNSTVDVAVVPPTALSTDVYTTTSVVTELR